MPLPLATVFADVLDPRRDTENKLHLLTDILTIATCAIIAGADGWEQISDWVPTRARVHALVDERRTRELCALFPGARLDVAASYGGTDRACRGRGQEIDAYQLIDLSFGDGQAKSRLYSQLLRAMMQDQVSWIRDRNHKRVVTEANGRDSLATPCEADALARRRGADR
jgi:hypothetical protein